jgi:hypothetical protein
MTSFVLYAHIGRKSGFTAFFPVWIELMPQAEMSPLPKPSITSPEIASRSPTRANIFCYGALVASRHAIPQAESQALCAVCHVAGHG